MSSDADRYKLIDSNRDTDKEFETWEAAQERMNDMVALGAKPEDFEIAPIKTPEGTDKDTKPELDEFDAETSEDTEPDTDTDTTTTTADERTETTNTSDDGQTYTVDVRDCTRDEQEQILAALKDIEAEANQMISGKMSVETEQDSFDAPGFASAGADDD